MLLFMPHCVCGYRSTCNCDSKGVCVQKYFGFQECVCTEVFVVPRVCTEEFVNSKDMEPCVAALHPFGLLGSYTPHDGSGGILKLWNVGYVSCMLCLTIASKRVYSVSVHITLHAGHQNHLGLHL